MTGETTEAATAGGGTLLLSRDEVATRPRAPLGETRGVTHAVLWERGRSSAGQLWFEANAELPEHAHDGHEHHLWVLSGRVEVGGRDLGSGAYCFVPRGRPHGFRAGREGCVIAYLYLDR